MPSANINIVAINAEVNMDQPAIIHSLKLNDASVLKQTTLLHTGQPIEQLSSLESYTDKDGTVWILPKSKAFPEFINTKYGTPKYMSTKENFLDKIIESMASGADDTLSPLFPYQLFVRDYMRLGTPYRALLLEHGLGAGKTRSVIETSKTFRRAGLITLVLTPAFLRLNFVQELNKWEDPDIDINAYYKFAHYNATGYSPGAKDKSGKDIGGKGGVFDQLAALGIGFDRTDKTYGKLFPYLYQKYKHPIEPPKHMLIVIEEAHNLNRSFINTGGAKVKSLLYPLLMKATDCKFMLLSGTPIISNPFEMAPMYNIMQGPLKDGHTAFPANEGEFNGYFVDYDTESFINEEIMMRRMLGMGSYFVGVKDDVKRVIFPDRKDIIVNLKTTPYQTLMHDKALNSEIPLKSKDKLAILHGADQSTANLAASQQELTPNSSYHTRSRAASNFVFPVSITRPSSGTKEWDKMRAYQFEFQIPLSGNIAPKALNEAEDYLTVYEKILEYVEYDEDTAETYEEEWSIAYELNDTVEMRRLMSDTFMALEKEFNDGMPVRHELYDYLTENDLTAIEQYVGKYADRIKHALRRLAAKPGIFAMAKLVHYSAKMAAIYKRITSDVEHGAPRLIDADIDVDSVDDQSSVQEVEPEDVIGEADSEAIAEIDTALSITVKPIIDPHDPIKPYEDVFLSDAQLPPGKIVEGGPAVVYSYFSKAEGAAIFSMVLQAHGFKHFDSPSIGPDSLTRDKRYAFFRGGMDNAVKSNILNVFNSKENAHGQLIRVIFVTQAAAEGISLFNVRQIHIMEPHWDNVMIEQVIGRGFRLRAHKFLKRFDERIITVYRYFLRRPDESVLNAKYPDYYKRFEKINAQTVMADELIQNIANRKDKLPRKLKAMRIKTSVDCYLNKEYNQPEEGCFTYRGSSAGPAFYDDIAEDFVKGSETKQVGTKEVSVKFISRNSKHYFYYTDEAIWLELPNRPNKLIPAQKLYGPVSEPAKAGEVYSVPEGAMPAGYYVKGDTKSGFLPMGVAKEVKKR